MKKCAEVSIKIRGIYNKVLETCGKNLEKLFRKFSIWFRKFKRKYAEVPEEIPKN